jgi:hypothetical protein
VATLLDIITHKGVHYTKLTNRLDKIEVRELAIKLWPLQDAVNEWPAGRIDIQPNGTVVITGFSVTLAIQISAIASNNSMPPF